MVLVVFGVSIAEGANINSASPWPRASVPVIFTPLMAACMVVAASAANGCFFKWAWFDRLLLVFQFAAGVYLVCQLAFSSLPATSRVWLIVPFNPLTWVQCKGHRRWALRVAFLYVAWEAFLILHPRRLVDPAYLVLVWAYVLLYMRMGWPWKCTSKCVAGAVVQVRPFSEIFKGLRRGSGASRSVKA